MKHNHNVTANQAMVAIEKLSKSLGTLGSVAILLAATPSSTEDIGI